MRRRPSKPDTTGPRVYPLETPDQPFREYWLSLTPGQRLVRSWRMRRLLKDPQAAHDALSLPRL